MIIDCISDLHGYYPKLDGGDLLIVAGDLTARDTPLQHLDFIEWLKNQYYKKKVVIAGNHDGFIEKLKIPYFHHTQTFVNGMEYLCDSGTEFEGLKIWGSPWTLKFPEMNPSCMAFTCDTEEELAEKWALIPNDIDILITHSPSYGVLDVIENNRPDVHVGSNSLVSHVVKHSCKIHIFGHIHEAYGKYINPISNKIYVNASHVNERYKPVNKPIRVIL